MADGRRLAGCPSAPGASSSSSGLGSLSFFLSVATSLRKDTMSDSYSEIYKWEDKRMRKKCSGRQTNILLFITSTTTIASKSVHTLSSSTGFLELLEATAVGEGRNGGFEDERSDTSTPCVRLRAGGSEDRSGSLDSLPRGGGYFSEPTDRRAAGLVTGAGTELPRWLAAPAKAAAMAWISASDLAESVTRIALARLAYLSVLQVSSNARLLGEIAATMMVRQLPPRESFNIRVSLLSR